VYVGGTFSKVGADHASLSDLAAIDPSTGDAVAGWNANLTCDYANVIYETTSACVDTVALSPDGKTLYAGGNFTAAQSGGGSVSRAGLVAVQSSDGSASTWNPAPDCRVPTLSQSVDDFLLTYGCVNAITVTANAIYVGGDFTAIGGQTRSYVAAVGPATGVATAWNPYANGPALSLAVNPGGTVVYTGGTLTSVGDQPRAGLAAMDASTGVMTAWNPAPDGSVTDLLAAPDGSIYAAGEFTHIGVNDAARNGLAKLDPASGDADAWDPRCTGTCGFASIAFSPDGSVLYAGGIFSTIGANAQPRTDLAALDANGNATAWNPAVQCASSPCDVLTLTVDPSDGSVYAGGLFSGIGGQSRGGLAAIDPSSGAATAWNPDPRCNSTPCPTGQFLGLTGPYVADIAVGPAGTVYVTGDFTDIGPDQTGREGVAALYPSGDPSHPGGDPTPWSSQRAQGCGAPCIDDVAVDDATGELYLIVGGGGAIDAGNQLFEADPMTGVSGAWAPASNGTVSGSNFVSGDGVAVAPDGTV